MLTMLFLFVLHHLQSYLHHSLSNSVVIPVNYNQTKPYKRMETRIYRASVSGFVTRTTNS